MDLNSITNAFDILGKKWNGQIIGLLLLNGASRFTDLANALPSCSDRVLSERLKELNQIGLIEKKEFSSDNDARTVVYQLTKRGQQMKNLMEEISLWEKQAG